MSRRHVHQVVLVAVLLVASLAAVAAVSQRAAASTALPTPKYGLHQDLTYDGYAWRRAQGIAIASDVHAQISRNSLLWSKIEPQKGSYDWSIPDSVVSELGAKGIEPLFVVVGSPSWANGVPSTTPGARSYVPTSPAAFAAWLQEYEAFVKAAVARYQGKVEKWEIWNEENERYFWKPGPNASQYGVFFTAIRAAILSVDPQAQVAIGGLTGLCCSIDIPGTTFLKTLIDANVPFDYVAIHPYSGRGQSPDVHLAWESNFDDIAAVHNLLLTAGRPVPLWATEWGWSSAQVGADVQAQYLGRSLELLKTQYPYVTVATYFLDVDRDTTYQQGLFDANYNPKPAAAVFAGFINSLGSQATPPPTTTTTQATPPPTTTTTQATPPPTTTTTQANPPPTATTSAATRGGGGGGGGGAQPDLTLKITTDAPPTLTGNVTYRLKVWAKIGNGGTGHATSTFTLPEQVQITSVYVGHGPGCAQAGQTLSCDLAWVSPSEPVTVIVQGTVGTPGSLSAHATVWAAGELNLTDNEATLTQTVTDPNTAPVSQPKPGTPGKTTRSAPPVTTDAPALVTLKGKRLAPGETLTPGAALALVIKKRLPGTPVRYQWQAAGPSHHYTKLAAQTGSTLKLTLGLVGKQVRLCVTVRTAGGTRTVTSKATVVVRAM